MPIAFHIFSSDFRHNYSDCLYYIKSISKDIYKNKKHYVTLTSFKPLSRQTRLSLSWEETFLFKSGSFIALRKSSSTSANNSRQYGLCYYFYYYYY